MENKNKGNGYVVACPTLGIGYATALELAKHGTVILVGRNREKLKRVENAISVVCNISDITSVKRAVQQITELKLPIAGFLTTQV
jgi:NAD(P)-dependent dehydrogenase (short-subunit alcohol dehydrogenase family)